MKEKLESLLRLQNVEMNISRLNAFLQTVAEKVALLDARQSVLQAEYDTAAAAMGALKKKYRDMEIDVQSNLAHIKKSQDKLGAIKNNKEYQAVLKEVDDVKDKNFILEDEMIACLVQMETFERELEEKKKNLDAATSQISTEKEAVRQEAAEDVQRLEEAEALQAELLGDVDKTLLADYMRVRRTAKGPAVVAVKKSICQGCFLNIPPQMFIELQRGGDKLKSCPHCDRILYWDAMMEA